MKRLTAVILLTLLGWNIILSYELYDLKTTSGPTATTSDTGTIYSGRTEISSDVSELVAKTENKVVTVISTFGTQEIGSGSGAIYKIDGKTVYVITNNHVIEDGTGAQVTFADHTTVDATIVGSDELSDLALLKMETESKVDAFTMGDSSLVKKGEYVIAMGSPLGIEYQGSVSGGLISGTNRNVASSQDWDMNVFQIDAAINPGNSGGPLINMAGELIGINSMKISNTDVEGFGFAIPINEVIPVVQQLEKNGKVVRPNLGINAADLSQLSMMQRIREGIEDEQGIMVTKIIFGGPAQKAGLKAGDIISKMDDTEISTMKQFRQTLYAKKVGDSITLTIQRSGKEQVIEVVLE